MEQRRFPLPSDIPSQTREEGTTPSLFLGVVYHNFGRKDKKKAQITVELNPMQDNLIYVATKSGRREVIAYKDPDTELYVAATEGVKGPNTYCQFRIAAANYARKRWEDWCEKLQKRSPEEQAKYKPVDQLREELREYWRHPVVFVAELQKEVNHLVSRERPTLNEYVHYEGEPIFHDVTCRVPYDDPRKYQLTEKETKKVDDFLDVFFDPYYKRAFSWYLGAMLLNYPVHHDRISKAMLLSSKKGGSGKSTLMELLAEAILTKSYYDIKPDFDVYFYQGEKFASMGLSRKRLTIYSEAEFSKDRETHDFNGMNISMLKSLITEGFLSTEEKHGDMEVSRLNGFHVICTNHLPDIPDQDEALERRLLGVMIKPTTMQKKAEKLRLVGKHKMREYLKEHAPLFASYFIERFATEEIRFDSYRYDKTDLIGDMKLPETEPEEMTIKESPKNLEQLCRWLKQNEKYQKLAEELQRAKDGEASPYVRVTEDTVYLTSQKKDLLTLTTNLDEFRGQMKQCFGPPIIKCKMRMWSIPRI